MARSGNLKVSNSVIFDSGVENGHEFGALSVLTKKVDKKLIIFKRINESGTTFL